MNKKVFRYFFDFVDKQEKWLNEMSARGYRLIHCGKLTYTFEHCHLNEYQYCIDFVGAKSHSEQEDYKRFLEGLGYHVQCKNINLNRSISKMRYRPWAGMGGKFSSSSGAFNRELLILEKKNDGKRFELHTDTQDAARYFKNLRNVYLCATVLCLISIFIFVTLIFTTHDFVNGSLSIWTGTALFLLVSIIGGFHAIKYALISNRYKELSKTNE